MVTYVTIYFGLAILGLTSTSGRQRQFLFVGLYVFLVLFVGTRVDTGCDFQNYANKFRFLKPDYISLETMTEPGYVLLNYMVKRAGLDFIWVNILGAAVFFYYMLKFARNHPRPFLLIALMFPILVIQLSMSGIRQALAVAFLMGAMDAFTNGKRAQVAIYILIGSTFHQSVIILLPLALMVGRTFSLARVLGAIAILLPAAIYLLSDRADVYQDRYIDQVYGEMSSGGAIFRLGLLVITACLFELYRGHMALRFPREYNLMRVFSLVCFALVPIMLVNTVALHRLIFYVVPLQTYMLAALPGALFANERDARVAELAPIALYAAYILVWFSISRHANVCYVPYESYLL